jgi:hypothetical protein
MVKNAISDYSSTAASNTDVGGVNIDEGMSPSGVNNAIRELMSHLADLNAGTSSLGTIKVDNLQLDANTISSTDTNGNINIIPNGTGSVVLDGINYPQADGTANYFLKTDGAGQLSFAQVDTASIADGAISTAKIADNAITGDKLADSVTIADSLTVTGTTSIAEAIEKVTIDTSTTGTINFDALTQAVMFFNTDQTANRTINFRGDSSTTLDSTMSVGESMTFAVLMTEGATAYYLNTYQVDGSAVTPEWSGGSAPSSGNASSIDVYSFTIIKTASATFTVLASQTQYA